MEGSGSYDARKETTEYKLSEKIKRLEGHLWYVSHIIKDGERLVGWEIDQIVSAKRVSVKNRMRNLLRDFSECSFNELSSRLATEEANIAGIWYAFTEEMRQDVIKWCKEENR